MGLAQSAYNNQALDPAFKAKIDKLRAQHILYKDYSPDWHLFVSAYEGGRRMANSNNMFKHSRENEEDFQNRVQRIHYLNYCQPIVDFFVNFIFSESIDRNGGTNTAVYDDFRKDVDLRGSSIDAYMRDEATDTEVFGMKYTLVDAPQIPDEIRETQLSQAFVKENKIRPYWVSIRPDEITDWVVDDFDNFQYVKRRQMVNEIVAGEILSIEKYTEWFQDKIVVNRIDITDPSKPKVLPEKTFANPLSIIPIQVARFKRSKFDPHMGVSGLVDFAVNNRDVMNLTSIEQEFLYKQAFNILAVETEGAIPLRSQEDGAVGTANKLEYPKGANAPQYISPPTAAAEEIRAERAFIIQQMFLRAAQDTLNDLSNGQQSSGFSQAQSFSKTVPTISFRADTLEAHETKLMMLTMKLMGREWDGKIKYKDRYELTSLTDAMTQLLMLARDLQLPSEVFVKEELKRLVHEFDGKITPDQMLTVEGQIDDMDFGAWQQFQKEAVLGPPKPDGTSSPGAQQKPKSTGTISEAAAEAKTPGAAATKKLRKKS